MITKKFGKDFESDGGALTLSPDCVGSNDQVGEFEKTHENGWTIKAIVREDYFYWINEFQACHPLYGKVWGDFEEEVYADSEEGYQNFYAAFTPEAWDYADI